MVNLTRQSLNRMVRSGNRISRMKLAECLRLLGVPRISHGVVIGNGVNQSRLWDLCEQAKQLYLAGVKRIRTDFAENHEAAVVWNALWAQAKKLFNRRGIEI